MMMDQLRKSRTLKKLRMMFTPSKRVKRLRSPVDSCDFIEGYGRPSVFHATVVIFLEFFAWGLLTSPAIQALKKAFPTGTFLKNGIIQGIKGILSFLSAPLIGALSDTWGRKSFLLLSVFFTCMPIPVLLFNATAYFIACALSGVFAVTFSIVFAYVADCTNESERSCSYGLVSATFAASLVVSPALGTWLETSSSNGETEVIIMATMITAFNLMFIVFLMPESLSEAARKTSWGTPITWEQANPFASLRKAARDTRLLRLSAMVFLSYLPEAGQYSCFFLYLRQVVGFSLIQVAIFIAVLCVTSVVAQTIGLSLLMSIFGHKYTIIIGLGLQISQLFIYGVWTAKWLMWIAGILAALSGIIYPAISALVSKNADAEQQGVALGILTGMRGLCNGLGPLLFGFIFYLSHVSLSETADRSEDIMLSVSNVTRIPTVEPLHHNKLFAGLPFLLGCFPVILAFFVALFISEKEPFGPKTRNSDENSPVETEHRNTRISISSS